MNPTIKKSVPYVSLVVLVGLVYFLYTTPTPQVAKKQYTYKKLGLEHVKDAEDIVYKALKYDTSKFMSPESTAHMTSDDRRALSITMFTDAVDSEDTYFVGAFDSDKLVGMLIFKRLSPTTGFLDHLYIREAYRGTGIGSRLTKMGMTHFKNNNPQGNMVMVNTREGNKKSRTFYEKRGFVKFKQYRELDYNIITYIKMIR